MLRTTVFVTTAALLTLGTASAHADHNDGRVRYVVGGALVGAAVGALAYQSSRDRRHAHHYHYHPAHYYPAPAVHYVPAPRYRHARVRYVPAPVVVVPPGHVRRVHAGPKHPRYRVVYYPY